MKNPHPDWYEAACFWSKVDVGLPTQCWPWRARSNSNGRYGRVRSGKILMPAHRFAYQLVYGDIPEGEGFHGTVVRHMCMNSLCCNPAHLQLGSQADNNRDNALRISWNRVTSTAVPAKVIKAIIADPRPTREIAGHYGISNTYVRMLKAGERGSRALGKARKKTPLS